MEKTFEASLEELEEIVAKLEIGDMQLEESLELFERGVKITRDCRNRITNAERKIEKLTTELNGSFNAEPLEFE